MIVVDASAVLDVLLGADDDVQLARCMAGAVQPLAAPDLLDVEVVSVLRRWERRREITGARARQALADLELVPAVRYPARALTDRVWRLRHNLTAYDAQYVALAQELGADLLTTDEAMAEAASRARVQRHLPLQ